MLFWNAWIVAHQKANKQQDCSSLSGCILPANLYMKMTHTLLSYQLIRQHIWPTNAPNPNKFSFKVVARSSNTGLTQATRGPCQRLFASRINWGKLPIRVTVKCWQRVAQIAIFIWWYVLIKPWGSWLTLSGSLIGVYNHLRNARYLDSITILRRWARIPRERSLKRLT